jgi:Tol biopolymer transport system component
MLCSVRGGLDRIVAAVLAGFLGAASPASAQVAALVSRNTAGTAADSHSYKPSISSDGRYVAFDSWASNLADGVDVENSGVFVRDLVERTTTLASTSDAGAVPNAKSYMSDISDDGRFVAFWSKASNLVAGDTNDEEDLFVYDRVERTVTRANLSSSGEQAEQADDGFHIVGERPALSADGRYVAFDSRAGNLVADDTNGQYDVFVRDRQAGTTECISRKSDGGEATSPSKGPAISDDGRFVAFWSQARLTPDDQNSNFDVYLYDRDQATLQRVGVTFGGAPAISGDGRFVAFESIATDLVPGDTNERRDVFVFTRESGALERVSVASDGTQGDADSSEPAISQDGRYVVYRSAAATLAPDDTNDADDIFLRDRQTGTTRRISVTASGGASDGFSREPAVTADGSLFVFESGAINFVEDDTTGAMDVYLAVRDDGCPDDPEKLVPGVCGCGVPDLDPDHDGVPGCNDACPDDPDKVADGVCGCGVPDTDTDADGAADCHDPNTPAGLGSRARDAIALARQLGARSADFEHLLEDIETHAVAFTAALNNDGFSAKQRKRLAAAAKALTELVNATGRAIKAKRKKAVRVLNKLLKAV